VEGNNNRWRELQGANEQLHKLHSSPNIVRVIKPRGFKWEEHVAHLREMRNKHEILLGNPNGKRFLETKVLMGGE
jgi:hypothetical protein